MKHIERITQPNRIRTERDEVRQDRRQAERERQEQRGTQRGSKRQWN